MVIDPRNLGAGREHLADLPGEFSSIAIEIMDHDTHIYIYAQNIYIYIYIFDILIYVYTVYI